MCALFDEQTPPFVAQAYKSTTHHYSETVCWCIASCNIQYAIITSCKTDWKPVSCNDRLSVFPFSHLSLSSAPESRLLLLFIRSSQWTGSFNHSTNCTPSSRIGSHRSHICLSTSSSFMSASTHNLDGWVFTQTLARDNVHFTDLRTGCFLTFGSKNVSL